jgi:serine/threonine-protein kinase
MLGIAGHAQLKERAARMPEKIVDVNKSRRRRRVHVVAGLGMAVAAVFASLAAFTPAKALADANSVSIMRSWATGVCLDSNYDGAAYVLPCNGGNFQNWYIDWGHKVDDEGHYLVELRDNETDLCLDVTTTSTSAAPLTTAPCDWGNSAEVWVWYGNPTVGQYHNEVSGACLDNNGAALYTLACNEGGNQDWRQGY